MSPTVTIDTDSEPGSWERNARLTERLFWAGLPGAFVTAPTPTCARCRAVLCGCPDTEWKG